ncbi:P-loop containing nucleoside triphosphate hydrolase protein [Mycena leptocephala]|nr:P-loop containing nucleoside triphosphate hydrolase protein [Mycena leptocephala]
MLPSEPKIFHGRDSELSDIVHHFSQGTPRIAILGAGGMGKTSLARAVIHHTKITGRYNQHRFFVACDSAATQVELAALIGAHVGLKPGKDLTHPVIQYFSSSSNCLLILDNLETLWEPVESRGKIEEFLSLLTGVDHLALVITMRGAERPAKVAWTHPFLPVLKPLEQDAAWKTFMDIADNIYDPKEVDKVLSLTDNLPLAISLIAHLVDSEGCSHVLSNWEEEKTSLISEGNDRTSNLDLSISLSLSSPRLNSHSKDLLSLLSMLPDGLSDVELVQSKFPIDNILGCKASLICTTLAYSDEHKRLKALVPIREYMQKIQPPGDHLIRPLHKHFQELLEFYMEYRGNESSSSTVARVLSNYSNIQNVLQNGLQQGHPDLLNSIYCIHNVLPSPRDHRLEAYVITEWLSSLTLISSSNPDTLASNALEHFEEFDDSDLKCRFYNVLANCYRIRGDISSAKKSAGTAIHLALATGNTKLHSQGLHNLAQVQWDLGDYFAAQMHAIEAQRLAIISADLYREAQALNIEAICCYTLGNYTKAMSLCIRARELLGFCGMSHGDSDRCIMNAQAEIHRHKSEYVEARSIHIRILEDASIQDPYNYGFALLSVTEIDVLIGAPKNDVQRNCDTARRLLNTAGNVEGVTLCDIILADLYLMEGNSLAAQTTFKRCLRVALDSQIQTYCLERLGDMSRWGCLYGMSSWTTVFLVHSLKRTEKPGIYKAFQFLGDVFLSQNDEHTATNLFTVALEGFTQMDVHRSRAECMLRFGDISMGHGNLLKAVEFWETARPLFERSSQAKQVQHIDERVANISKDVLEQHRNNLACLADLNAPARTVEELEDDLSDIEDLNKVDMGEAKELGLIVV